MKTILVVDDEKMILRLATEALESQGEDFNVMTALNGKQAVQILNSTRVDLVLTDLKMPVMDGYELLSYMSKNYRNTPIIVMTGFGSPEIGKRLKQKGVLHYIEKPFEIDDLKEKVSAVFTEKSKGYIHGFTLANFLQAVEVEQKTLTLRIRSKGRVGYLYLEKGELTDAENDDGLKGETAAIAILCWDNAEIELKGIHNRDRTIDASLMHILLEASKLKDENSENKRDTTEDLLNEAIRLAEAHHFKEARNHIARYLKQRPRNPIGWLWYSRIIIHIRTIEMALKNAIRIAPENPEIMEDVRKLKLAREQPGASGQVRRCPFCWFPMNIKAVQCPFCKSHLFIHNSFFSSLGHADAAILERAIERYMKVISREKNINAHYFLSVAHLNLEHWEEALNLFHKTVKLAPDKEIFTEQLRALVNHMAMDATTSAFEKETRENAADGDASGEVPPPPRQAEKKKILVVEDSSTTRKVITITLSQKGYDIIEARDGLEALSRLNEEKPDLILLDIILPKMDGYKILSIIKSNAVFKEIPVIMLTSRDGFMHKVKGKLAGSAAYLTKPFDPTMLVETIEKYL
ncbi:response regulator [Desulfonema ishimotonii]|uniref:response regulator n=1 Tax=Desulfonema ishimotonii TaxID=45657 RepID=UPI00140A396F|nr:response regulator [Desulfonema ishimotonii]